MAPPSKRRCLDVNDALTNGSAAESKAVSKSPLAPVTVEDRRQWQGFCEIESEPAFFNVMLRDFGVKGVKVQEVFGLDDELLAMLPQPVYGLIFLFRYRSEDDYKQEASCPDNVWFANQTHEFACATVSLLNIVNNIPNVDIGAHLQSFRDFTKDFTPAMRGDQIGSFEFVKQIHNSFARKMDMFCIDLGMENAFDDRKRASARKSAKGGNGKKKSNTVTADDYIDDDAAFHFIAFVPIDGEVWGLDGLNRQPVRLGSPPKYPVSRTAPLLTPDCSIPGSYDAGVDWLSVVTPVLRGRIAQYEEGQIEFSLLSLVRDPILELEKDLAASIKGLRAVETRLDVVRPEWRTFSSDGADGDLTRPNHVADHLGGLQGVTEDAVTGAEVAAGVMQRVSTDNAVELMALRQELVTSMGGLRRMVAEEEEATKDDERRARERRHDYGPAIHRWLTMLAEKEGVMKELVESLR